jgi:hypothetical protein
MATNPLSALFELCSALSVNALNLTLCSHTNLHLQSAQSLYIKYQKLYNRHQKEGDRYKDPKAKTKKAN